MEDCNRSEKNRRQKKEGNPVYKPWIFELHSRITQNHNRHFFSGHRLPDPRMIKGDTLLLSAVIFRGAANVINKANPLTRVLPDKTADFFYYIYKFFSGDIMSGNSGRPINIDFQVDKTNLYREETVTDLKIASIQKLTPIHPDGSDDPSREAIYVGNTQLGTPHGPVPIQARLEGVTLDQAMEVFPQAMEAETQKVIEQFKKMEAEQKKSDDSRIIIPGLQ